MTMVMVVMLMIMVLMSMRMVMLMVMTGAFLIVLMFMVMVVMLMIMTAAILAVLMAMVVMLAFVDKYAPLAVLTGNGRSHTFQTIFQGLQLCAEHDGGDPHLRIPGHGLRQVAPLDLHRAAGGGEHDRLFPAPLDIGLVRPDHGFLLVSPKHGDPQLLYDLIPKRGHPRRRLQRKFG